MPANLFEFNVSGGAWFRWDLVGGDFEGVLLLSIILRLPGLSHVFLSQRILVQFLLELKQVFSELVLILDLLVLLPERFQAFFYVRIYCRLLSHGIAFRPNLLLFVFLILLEGAFCKGFVAVFVAQTLKGIKRQVNLGRHSYKIKFNFIPKPLLNEHQIASNVVHANRIGSARQAQKTQSSPNSRNATNLIRPLLPGKRQFRKPFK